MRHRTAAALACTAALAGGALVLTGGSAVAGHEQPILHAALDGKEEVPVRGDANGRGEALLFALDDESTLCYVLEVDKIAPATMAHIHEGGAGVAGPVVATLARPADGDSVGCLADQAALVAEIKADPGAYYVNVHNEEFPGGAVRGQLGTD